MSCRKKTVFGLSLFSVVCVILMDRLSYYRPITLKNESTYHSKVTDIFNISCSKLVEQDGDEVRKATSLTYESYTVKRPLDSFFPMDNCEAFIDAGFYQNQRTRKNESTNFSIGYSILMYTEPDRTLRLLRAIYDTQNFYCIHIDKKAKQEVFNMINFAVGCLDNVFFPSRRLNVTWSKYSVLEAEMTCIRDLWKYKWKYFINLTGQEFPLMTNNEIITNLQKLRGSTLVEYGSMPRNRIHTKQPPPAGIHLAKGSTHVILHRDFVEYILHNKTAIEFLHWAKNLGVPDEHFFNSLLYSNVQQYMPNLLFLNKQFITQNINHSENVFIHSYGGSEIAPNIRYKHWRGMYCGGKRVRQICINGIKDLPILNANIGKAFFVNKFNEDYQPLAYDCLEKILQDRAQLEMS